MRNRTLVLGATGLLLLAIGSGCAAAYHDYASCYVPCRYCPPPPLPFVHYAECVCHSCAAERHLAAQVAPMGTVDASATDAVDTSSVGQLKSTTAGLE